MPSIISHPAVPLAIGIGLGTRIIPTRLVLAGVVAAIVPDLDVYISALGHRGPSHSLVFALMCGIAAAAIAPALKSRRTTALLFVTLAAASHGLLDGLTNGGPGITYFWPFQDTRYFMPVRMIRVSPIGIGPFFSARGLAVLASELQWVWAPALLLAIGLSGMRRGLSASHS